MHPGGVFTIAEAQTAYITDKLHKTLRKREIVTKKLTAGSWGTLNNTGQIFVNELNMFFFSRGNTDALTGILKVLQNGRGLSGTRYDSLESFPPIMIARKFCFMFPINAGL